MSKLPQICVCICTYKRPQLLGQLLAKLLDQGTLGLFDYSIVVVDNDKLQSAQQTVKSFAPQSQISLSYYVEPEQNIALARNMAVSHASGDFVAFIDDDESPIDDWLLRMYQTLLEYKADGVLGRVIPIFELQPPQWIVRAKLFERPTYAKTGSVIDWKQTGMGNVLIRRSVLEEVEGPFMPEFGSGGEDLDFFRRAISLNMFFVWCGEGVVYEMVTVKRTHLSFQIKRALLRGKASLCYPYGRTFGIFKSLLACVLYTVSLPIFLMMGRHVFVKYLIKDIDHIGKLLAVCGLDVVKEKYIQE